jgi:hypothetical protein
VTAIGQVAKGQQKVTPVMPDGTRGELSPAKGRKHDSPASTQRRTSLEVEFCSELHGSRVGFNVRDLSKGTPALANGIRLSIWARRQAPTRVRKSQVLVIESVEDLPAELEVTALGKPELLEERRIQVPETRGAGARQSLARIAKSPVSIVVRNRVCPEGLIASKRRFESSGDQTIG